jgi:hypothetical protein
VIAPLLFAFGCDEGVEAESSIFVPLDDARLARRISIDLRGELPTPAEVAVAAEPGGVDVLVERWLADPGFETHLAELIAEEWLLRLDALRVDETEFGLAPEEAYAFTRSFGDEPARLFAHVVATDRPFTELVTTDVTMANALLFELAALEPVDPTDDAEWQEARYTDGRPANGVLATSGLWLRYHTTIFNYNRGRAATLARLLLCYDFASRPVLFKDIADESSKGLAAAVTTEPGCVACHAALDPLADTLFGFWPVEDLDGRELIAYFPEREPLGPLYTGSEPAYWGTPVTASVQLGPLVANDPRFPVCLARRATERLLDRPTDDGDNVLVYGTRDALVSTGRYKDALRALLASEEYRAGSLSEAATDADRERVRVRRRLSPNTLARVVEGLTGFRWTYDATDMLDGDLVGLRSLAGGADGETVRRPYLDPTASRTLVIRRLAQAAAGVVAERDAALPREDRRLLGTTVDDVAGVEAADEAFDRELTALGLAIFAEPPAPEEVEALRELYAAIRAEEGGVAAWSSVISLLLRDPQFWAY